MDRISRIDVGLSELREALKNHKLYQQLSDLEDIRTFMEWHVYAVWDFMSLLKSLQQNLTCTEVPWKPVVNPKIARFINEIVHGEESDLNVNGEPESHFEMYTSAMSEVGADVTMISNFLGQISDLNEVLSIIDQISLPAAVKSFLNFTFETIQSNEVHKIASAFTFGREDVIPDMFLEILNKSGKEAAFPKLKYYLERHIELDGDEHGPLSLEMISEICGGDEQKWEEVLETGRLALQKRLELWDAIAGAIEMKDSVFAL
ncbi:DUF3050 domain-containing protein [Jiulongibacter sediminis]|uniref:DUF3050 domain-containing protein n=1 Tax=Jiulongibacter sediminis TaxID=1605367 RepID=UPI0026F25E15|nr:DUF3050 domain-containing protein [Jiulongibacter sediminis]